MKGLPRWGVLTVVKDNGVYSVGLTCDIKCRPINETEHESSDNAVTCVCLQSSPPMECASKLTPRPIAFA